MHEIADVFEFAVDAGEADEGHLIERPQFLHEQVAEIFAVDFRIEVGVGVVFDGGDDGFQLLVADRTLPAGFAQADFDFFALERLAHAVFLDDVQHRFFDPFVRGEASAAMHAFPAATDGKAILPGAGVDHFVVIERVEPVGVLLDAVQVGEEQLEDVGIRQRRATVWTASLACTASNRGRSRIGAWSPRWTSPR